MAKPIHTDYVVLYSAVVLWFECIPWAQLGFCFSLDPLREESRVNEQKIIELQQSWGCSDRLRDR